MTWEVREGDALERLREMGDESVQCCVTSPPFFGLRDYGVEGQIGLERTPDEFVARLVEVFREVRRVLRADGTLWLNMGDSYATQPKGNPGALSSGLTNNGRNAARANEHRGTIDTSRLPGVKSKDLLGIPWLLAFALRADGWYLRSDIIWAKPNPMPESVTDRPTSAHEHVFLLAKSARYFYDADAIREPDLGTDHPRSVLAGQPSLEPSGGLLNGHAGIRTIEGRNGSGRNKRNVWEIATQPYPDAHFATFPPKLVEPCILAGSSPRACGECGAPWERVVEREFEPQADVANSPALIRNPKALDPSSGWGDSPRGITRTSTTGWAPSCSHHDDTGSSVVLDPFAGSGTTGMVALRHNRSFIGIELSPTYAEMARNRIRDDAPLLNCSVEVGY